NEHCRRQNSYLLLLEPSHQDKKKRKKISLSLSLRSLPTLALPFVVFLGAIQRGLHLSQPLFGSFVQFAACVQVLPVRAPVDTRDLRHGRTEGKCTSAIGSEATGQLDHAGLLVADRGILVSLTAPRRTIAQLVVRVLLWCALAKVIRVHAMLIAAGV